MYFISSWVRTDVGFYRVDHSRGQLIDFVKDKESPGAGSHVAADPLSNLSLITEGTSECIKSKTIGSDI